jgi:hypothetical protein
MRNNKKLTAAQRFEKLALLTALALCFVFAFGAAVSSDFDIFASGGGDEVFVASADGYLPLGGTNPIVSDQYGGAIDAKALNFPGANNTSTWTTSQLTFTNTTFDETNVSVAFENDKIESRSLESISGGARINSEATGNNGAVAAVNYQFPDLLSRLITSNDKFKISVSGGLTLIKHDDVGGLFGSNDWQRVGYRVIGAPTAVAASNNAYTQVNDGYDDARKNTYTYTDSKNGSEKTLTFSNVEMSGNNSFLVFLITCGESSGSFDFSFKNIYFTITVTYNTSFSYNSNTTVYDYSAPALDSFDTANTLPYRPNGESSENWPVYNSLVSKAVDNVSADSFTSKLYSYTNAVLGVKGGKSYFKTTKFRYVDAYSYAYFDDNGNLINVKANASGVDERYFAGIKSITIGAENDGSGAVFYSYNGTSQQKSIYVENENGVMEIVGYAEVAFSGSTYGIADVTVYMYANAEVKINVSDYGNLSINKKLDVKGIDTDNPAMMSLDTSDRNIYEYDGAVIDPSRISWINASFISFGANDNIVEDDGSRGYSPYLWYYSVKKSMSIDGLGTPTAYTVAQLKNMTPFASGTLNDFTYDFITGKSSVVGNGAGLPAATGAGYYLFTFYVVDLAGNIQTQTVSYYAKVDYATPEYELTAVYGSKSITPATNGLWATDTLRITLALSGEYNYGESFSGNTVTFEDYNDVPHTLILKDGKIVSVDGAVINSVEYTINRIDITYASGFLNFVYGSYDLGGGEYDIVDKITLFTALVGVDGNLDAPSYSNSEWKINKGTQAKPVYEEGIWVRVDKNKPTDPTVFEASGLMQDGDNNGSLEIPSAFRGWYTSAWSLPTTLGFFDYMSNSYGSSIHVYFGIKYQGFATSFENNFSHLTKSDFDSIGSSGVFDGMSVISGNEIDGTLDFDLDLIQSKKAGMRVIYVWAVDQAGNVSALSKYYILVDADDYSVSTVINHGVFSSQNASILQTDDSGGQKTKFKRGQSVYFSINMAQGYVPYKFIRTDSKTPEGTTLLLNSGTERFFDFNDDYIYADGLDIGVTLDDDALTILSTTAIQYTFSYREIVTYTVTNTSVPFTDTATVVPMTISDQSARESFVFAFKNSEGVDIEAPSEIGAYSVSVSIDTDSYIGRPTPDLAYSIVKRNAVVKAIATSGIYGGTQTLGYTISGLTDSDSAAFGLDPLSLVLTGSLKLNTSQSDYTKLKAGQYSVIQNEAFTLERYNVSFESAIHTVAQREVVAIIKAGQYKTFGDADPVVLLSVDTSQYAEGDVCSDIFLNFYLESSEHPSCGLTDGIRTMGSTHVMREAGENVGMYGFYNDTENFEINPNYKLTVDAGASFEIKQRNVVLYVANNQFSVFDAMPNEETIAEISVNYTLSGADLKFASYITGTPALSASDKPSEISGGFTVYFYDVSLGSIGFYNGEGSQNNVAFTLASSDTEYLIKIISADKKIVLIEKKSGVSIERTYNGKAWNTKSSLNFSQELFNVSGLEEYPSYTIKWETALSGSTNVAQVGSYPVNVTNIQILDEGNNRIDNLFDSVEILPFSVKINPARVGIVPVVNNFTKTYGENDSAFNIAFEVYSINGSTNLDEFNFYPASAIQNGAFTRGIYSSSGELLALGSQYDTASDSSGKILNGGGKYYGVAIGVAYSSSNVNYEVFVDYDAVISEDGGLVRDIRFVINPRKIELDLSDFSAYSKAYDGDTDVSYASGQTPVNFNTHVVRMADKIELVYNAAYDSAEIGQRSVIFTNMSLSGSEAVNYVLYYGENAVIPSTTVTVSTTAAGGNIYITKAEISLSKNDITLQKQYDGTVYLGAEFISFSKASGLSGLVKEFDNGATYAFSQADVTANFSVAHMVLFFPDDNPEANFVINRDESATDIEIVMIITGGSKGIRITVNNLQGSIIPREITPDSFSSFKAVDRDYNGSDGISIVYNYNSSALGSGDEVSDVGLEFTARAVDKNAGAVNASGIIIPTTVILDSATVTGSNYSVDLEDFTSYYSGDNALKATISKAKLLPDVSFKPNREYDGTTALVKGTDVFGSGTLTTVNYAGELSAELQCFSYDWESVSFEYSLKGAAYKNVVFDSDGNVAKHNITVSGLKVTETGGNGYLANYELYGFKYNSKSDEYENIADMSDFRFVSATTEFGSYELISCAPLLKRVVEVAENYVSVKDKFYDGTTSASYEITAEKILENERDNVKVELDVAFQAINAGTNIDVRISNPKLVNNSDDGLDYTLNYSIDTKFNKIKTASIFAAPVVVTASLGTKTYNGSAAVSTNDLGSRSIEGLIGKDVAYYGLYIGSAAFNDKNVSETDGIVTEKDGNLYNVRLVNNNSGIMNYVLTYKREADTADEHAYYSAYNGGTYINYYLLPTTSTYISDDVLNSLDEENKQLCESSILGTYIYSKDNVQYTVYLLPDAFYGQVEGLGRLESAVNIVGSSGTIKKKTISITVTKPENYSPEEGANPYNKVYDGTTYFGGAVDVDFVLGRNVTGIVESDELIINPSDVTARFTSADAGYSSVEFSVSALSGADAGNYDIASATCTINDAYISKLEISALLNDDEITYGSAKQEYSKITYTLGGKPLTVSGGRLYMALDDYQNVFTRVNVADISANRYELNTGVFNQNDDGDYVRLSGRFNLPTGTVTVNSIKPVGVYEYTLKAGDSTNYTFKAMYTDTEKGVSKISVTQAVVYVYADAASYTKVYGGASPKINLAYSSSQGIKITGLKNGETPEIAFGAQNLPTAEFRLYSEDSGWATEAIGKYAALPSDLPDNQFYGVYIKIPAGASNGNYRVEFMTTDIANITRLNITLPVLGGVTAQNKTMDYTGSSLASGLLRGNLASDSIECVVYEFDGASWVELPEGAQPVNVGRYRINYTVSRPIDGDVNGYGSVWTGTGELTVTAATLGMSSEVLNEKFDFNAKVFDKADLNFLTSAGLDLADIAVSYEKRVSSVDSVTGKVTYSYQPVSFVLNAGTYRVKLQYNPDAADLQTAVPQNFAAETAYVALVVSPITIKVTANSPLKQILDGENGNGIEYSLALTDDYNDILPSSVIPETQIDYYRYVSGENQQSKADVDKAGKYTYVVSVKSTVSDIENYKLLGAYSGILEVGSVVIEAKTSDSVSAVLSVPESGTSIIAEKLECRVISQSNAQSRDDIYWAAINGYMGAVGSDETPATLKSVVRLSLSYNGTVIQPSETVHMKVAVPKAVDGTIGGDTVVYYVTATGSLAKLNSYTVQNGYIEYDTDYVSALVFVQLGKEMPAWEIAVIAVGSVVGAAVIAGSSVGIVRALKRKKSGISLDEE